MTRIALALELTTYLKRHTDIFAGALSYANQETDWTCVIDDFVEHTLSGSAGGYRGVIGRVTEKLAASTKRKRTPLVNVWRSSPVSNLYGVYPDFAMAGEMAARHLLDRGVRRLACVFRGKDPSERMLAERFQAVARGAGQTCKMIPVGIRFAHTLTAWKKTRKSVKAWLDHAALPVGVLASLDILGRHVAQMAGENRQLVPRDVAIVSAHNEPTLCHQPEPSLTSIEYGFDRVGFEAAKLLDQLLQGRKPDAKSLLVPPSGLVIRRSSDFLFSDDEVVTLAMQFIAERTHRSLSVSQVARRVNVSRRVLEQKFERHAGRTVAAEIRRVRIDHAKRLLAGSSQTIAQIARDTGFGSANQLARVFRRELGMSPRDYRAQRQSDSPRPERTRS